MISKSCSSTEMLFPSKDNYLKHLLHKAGANMSALHVITKARVDTHSPSYTKIARVWPEEKAVQADLFSHLNLNLDINPIFMALPEICHLLYFIFLKNGIYFGSFYVVSLQRFWE